MTRRRTLMLVGVAAFIIALIGVRGSVQGVGETGQAKLDTAGIEQLTGAKGTWSEEEGVFKVSLPRGDIAATVAGVKMSVPMGLGGWASFKKAGDQCMVMGDSVLLEDQVNPVMSVALDEGLEVTALHNHFMWDSPRVMFMHVGGMGDETRLARAVGKVFAKIRQTAGGKGETPKLDIDASKSVIDGRKIEDILGHKGDPQGGGVFKVTVGRTITMHGHEVGNMMGINTWASFAGSDDKAVVDGDFIMTEAELQPVLKTLRAAGINIVAIHNHMTFEQPRAMFLHFWGVGSTGDLARGIKRALDAQAGVKTVYVETFDNKTFYRGFENSLTRALVNEINAKTHMRIVPRNQADTVISGQIRDFKQVVLSEDLHNNTREMRVTAYVDMTWTDRRTGQVIKKVDGHTTSKQIKFETGQTLETATTELFQDLAKELVEKLETDW